MSTNANDRMVRSCGSPASSVLWSGHAPVNGISMYYEVHGQEETVPLVLLHGGGSTIEVTFSRVLPVFARSRKVIAVEEQGHGRTSDRDAPVRFESSADDVAALLRFLKEKRADVLGFSNGASVALQVGIRHPGLVRKLVFASSFTKRDGAQPQLWEFMKQADFSTMPLTPGTCRIPPPLRLPSVAPGRSLSQVLRRRGGTICQHLAPSDARNLKLRAPVGGVLPREVLLDVESFR